MNFEKFEISFVDPRSNEKKTVSVSHTSEPFDLTLEDSALSIINNGDNSWSLVEGNADQETVNAVGTAIEDALNGS